MPENAPQTRDERLKTLKQALAIEGVALRSDSSLCKCYIDGFLDPNVYDAATVAHVCALHKFLYCYTSYAADCHAVLPSLAARLAGPLGGWNAAWSYVKESEAPIIKAAAIGAAGGIPQIWPWQRHADKELEDEMSQIEKDMEARRIDVPKV